LPNNIGISFGSADLANHQSVVIPVQGGISVIEQPPADDPEKRDSNGSIVSVSSLLLLYTSMCNRMQNSQYIKINTYNTQ
jgi:hypothetical protein